MRLRRALWLILPLGLALLAGLYWLGQSQWLGRALEASLATLLRTPVAVEGARLDLLSLQGRVERLRIASRRDPARWAFDGGPAVFQLQFWPLLEGKLVVERLEFTGITGDTPRRADSPVPPPPTTPTATDDGPTLSERLQRALPRIDLRLLAQRLDLEALTADRPLATVAWSESQIQRWREAVEDGRRELEALAGVGDELDALRRRIDALQVEGHDPRRLKEQLQAIDAVRRDLQDLRRRLRDGRETMRRLDFSVDQAGWQQARAEDLALIDRVGGLDLERLAEALFGAPVVERLGTVLAALQGARGLLSGGDDDPPPPPPRRAGHTFTFPVDPPLPPAFLLQQGRLAGEWPGRGPFELDLTQLSSAPAQWHRPVEFRLRLGERPVWRLSGTLDHRRGHDQDRIRIQAAPLSLAAIPLDTPTGQPLPTALSLEAGRLEGEVSQQAGRLEGRLQLRADRVRFHFPEQAAVEAAYRPYYPELRRLFLQRRSAVRVEIRLNGTLESPRLRLSSSLDQELGDGLRRLLGDKLQRARQRLRERLDAQVEARLQAARAPLEEQAQALRERLQDLEDRAAALDERLQQRRRALEAALAEQVEQAGERLQREAEEQAKEKARELLRGLGL